MPDLVENREIMTTHQINLDLEPAEIVWSKRELSVEERKYDLKQRAKAQFSFVVNEELKKETDMFPETQYDAAVVDAARVVFENQMTSIDAATTHEDLDLL